MPDSCDTALSEYNQSELALADAYAVMVAAAAATAFSVLALLLALAIAVALLATLGTPAAAVTWAMFGALAGVAALAAAAAVVGLVVLIGAYLAWRAAMERRENAYATVYAKCPSDRWPPPPV